MVEVVHSDIAKLYFPAKERAVVVKAVVKTTLM